MRTQRYVDVIVSGRIKTATFKPLKGDKVAKTTQLFWNLWNQFGLTPAKIARLVKNGGEVERPSITDYAWTPRAKRLFYAHPRHKKFIKEMTSYRGMAWGLFKLNFEPEDYDTRHDINGLFNVLRRPSTRIRGVTPTVQGESDNNAAGTSRGNGHIVAHATSIRTGKKSSKKRVPHACACKRVGTRTAGHNKTCCGGC